jgi:hypothetical protein
MLRLSALAVIFVAVACTPAPSPPPPAEETDAEENGPPGPLFETHPPAKSKPAHTVGGFTIQLPEETLAPGDETNPCYIFPLEVTGPSRIVGGGVVTVGKGMHHGNIVTQPKTGEGFRPCPPGNEGAFGGEAGAVLDGGAVLFGSSTQIQGQEWQRFPDGMGYPIEDGFEIVARMHYLNATGEPLTVAPHYEWFTIDEAKVSHELGPFAWVLDGWEIPPKSEFTATAGCNMLGPMHLVHVLPHMHRMGKSFSAELVGGEHDGLRFLDSPGYDPDNGVMLEYTPSLDLSIADGFRFSCTWQNTLDVPLHYGEGDGEMCILFGYAYPRENAYSAISTGESSCFLAAASAP